MYIPKNTVLILNLYDIHHNEEKYPDPYAPTFPTLIPFKVDKYLLQQIRFQPRSLPGRHVDI